MIRKSWETYCFQTRSEGGVMTKETDKKWLFFFWNLTETQNNLLSDTWCFSQAMNKTRGMLTWHPILHSLKNSPFTQSRSFSCFFVRKKGLQLLNMLFSIWLNSENDNSYSQNLIGGKNFLNKHINHHIWTQCKVCITSITGCTLLVLTQTWNLSRLAVV